MKGRKEKKKKREEKRGWVIFSQSHRGQKPSGPGLVVWLWVPKLRSVGGCALVFRIETHRVGNDDLGLMVL